MQTFLPYRSFTKSAKCLDRQRLCKQRVETLQILKALLAGGGWQHHPAAKMWQGYENALIYYGIAICDEWRSRGYKDTCLDKITAFYDSSKIVTQPPWLGNYDFHISHQSNLVRKDPNHYRQFFPNIPEDLPYVWPSKS